MVTRYPLLPAAWCLLAAVAVPGVSGCARSGVPRGDVAGRVTVQGQPVTRGMIVFENAAAGVSVSAELGPDGRYEVSTYQGRGLPAGTYQVAVVPRRLAATDETPMTAPPRPDSGKDGSVIPIQFHSVQTSRLTAEVKAGSNPPFDFDLVTAK